MLVSAFNYLNVGACAVALQADLLYVMSASHMSTCSSPSDSACHPSSSLLMCLGEKWRMAQVLGYCTHVGDLEGSFWLQIISTLASEVIWAVNQHMNDLCLFFPFVALPFK